MPDTISPRTKEDKHNLHVLLGGVAGVFVLLILGLFSLSIVNTYFLRTGSLASVISSVLVDLANGDRQERQIGGLSVSPVLTTAAQAKANDMAAKSYFAHVSPEGYDSWHWFKEAGYSFLYAGENLAVDFSDSIDVERAWMNSPTHRANILDGHFTEIGIATAQGVYDGRQTTFVVQLFGTPAEAGAPRAAIETIASPAEPTAPALATTKGARKVPVSPVAVATATIPVEMATVTTTPAVVAPAPTEAVLGTAGDSILPASVSWWERLLASPKTMLEWAYAALAIVILVVLAYVTELEFHKRHMGHVAVAALLFVLMTALLVVADTLFFSHTVISAAL